MIKAVIFDMDGVLIDSEPVYLEAMLRFARMKNPGVTEDTLHPIVGLTTKDCWEVMRKAIDNGQSWEELREEYHKWTDVYERMDYTAIFREEARGLLAELKRRGYRLALASSTKMILVNHVLFQNRILKEFELVVSGHSFKRSKPDPEIYLHTAKELGLKPEECFAVEDSTPGILSAHRAGMTVAALIDERFGFDREPADVEVRSLAELLAFLPDRNKKGQE